MSVKRARYDFAIVGAGPAGLEAAELAARHGQRVALFEAQRLGGTSLTSGSIPSKALIRAATLFAGIREVSRLQDAARPVPVANLKMIFARLGRIEQRIARYHSLARLTRLGIDVFFGHAHFLDRQTLASDTACVQFRHALIATGARPAPHGIPGLTDGSYLTSESVFDLQQLPEQLAVVGGGPLGCEFAQAFCRLGSTVTIVQNDAKFLPKEERDAAQILSQSMARDGVNIVLNTTVVGATVLPKGVRLETLRYNTHGQVTADHVLVSVGRVPNIAGLELEAAGIAFNATTGIAVDAYLRTSNARVYAAGDVCMTQMYTNVAEDTGRMAVRNALGRPRYRHTDLLVPWCTFTVPEVAHVGLQVWETPERGTPIHTYTAMMADVDRAITDLQDSGFVKLHVAEGTDRILGATVVAARASEMINEICVAMHGGVGLRALGDVLHTYPAQSAAIRQAALSFREPSGDTAARITPKRRHPARAARRRG
jgi:pyruvate/2-oxoglutarate dehydrogenase complex dihydrolipoamide dehydrogenase (E3) component